MLASEIKPESTKAIVRFHSDISKDAVVSLLKYKHPDDLDQYAYTAVKHYIIAISSSGFPVGYHTPRKICKLGGINNSKAINEIAKAMDYAVYLGYLNKVGVFGEDNEPLYEIIKFWV